MRPKIFSTVATAQKPGSAEKDAALRKGKLKRQDVVLTTRGTVGNVAFYEASIPFDHIRINSGMVVLRANEEELSPRFLYHFVRSKDFAEQVLSLATGSAQPQLPIRDIKQVEIYDESGRHQPRRLSDRDFRPLQHPGLR